MKTDEIPVVLSVQELGGVLKKSRSWIYDQWKRTGNDLPQPFKIGSNTRVLGKDVKSYLEKRIAASLVDQS